MLYDLSAPAVVVVLDQDLQIQIATGYVLPTWKESSLLRHLMPEFPLGTYLECYRGKAKDEKRQDRCVCLPICWL